MKKTILSAIFIVLLNSLSLGLYAQSSESSKGTFDVTKSSGEVVNVHYSVGNAYPDNLAVQFSPNASFTLNSHITDNDGNEVLNIETANVEGRYANSIDLSSLAKGSYFLEVSTGNEEHYRIAFTK